MKLIQFEPLFIRHFSTIRWPFALHNHNHYELMFIGYGKGIHKLNKTQSNYINESIFFLAPEDEHDFYIEEETQFNVIKFLPVVLKSGVNASTTDYWDHLLRNLAQKWTTDVAQQIDAGTLKSIKTLIGIMIQEWQQNNQKVTEIHSNLLRSVLLMLDRSIKSTGNINPVPYGETKLERIQNYLYANIHFPGNLTIKALSHNFSLSESGIRSLFKRKMGLSLRTYISSLKLEKIKNKMKNSDHNLSEIAREFGFTDASHFNKFFKKQSKMKPLSYRKGL